MKLTDNNSKPVSVHHSIASKFYSNGKFKHFKLRAGQNKGDSIYILFSSSGLKVRGRSINAYGFDYAFDEVFSFGCSQLNINEHSPSIVLLKSLLKQDLLLKQTQLTQELHGYKSHN